MPRLLLILLVCLLTLAGARPAAAQMRDAENAAPRVPVSVVAAAVETSAPAPASLSVAQYHQLLHDLTAMLALTPPQVVAVRQALAARLAATTAAAATIPAIAADQALRAQLTAGQVARLEQWQAARPDDQRISLLAGGR